jgi:cation diffusion facilitator CzcD-associated flavoprotein CzcO
MGIPMFNGARLHVFLCGGKMVLSLAHAESDNSLRSPCSEGKIVQEWLDQFSRFVAGEDQASNEIFAEKSYWRDALTFTWDIRTVSGRGQIVDALAKTRVGTAAASFVVSQDPPPQFKVRAGLHVLEAFFDFQTKVGRGRGIVRLMSDSGTVPVDVLRSGVRYKAWTLLTTLQELTGAEARTGPRRPRGGDYSHGFGRPNWLDRRKEAATYSGRDPEVLIVGGGQAGMTLAARLRQAGVDSLVIDRHARSGDNWRRRYDALALHNEAWVCDLPFMPFPATWPVYLPKDMIAGWLESYAWAMELNIWTSTEFLGADFDAKTKRWSVRMRREGAVRTLVVKHLVIATGLSGGPKMPSLPGLDEFEGDILHTHSYTEGSKWKGKRAVVIGTGNSGHDVAQDLSANGVTVTMVQRSPTTIVSVEPAAQLVFALYSEGPSTEDCDLLSVSIPHDMMIESQKLLTRRMLELDKELIDGLESVGFRTDIGDDETGYYIKYLRTGGGYYLNVGCSELIAKGDIKILQNEKISHYVAKGIELKDGSLVAADLIVVATGYENMQETVRRLLGEKIANNVGPIWGFDEHGDMRNVWKQTSQENLWLMAGSFAQCRTYSRYVALQIKAIEDGLTTHRTASAG